MIGPDASAFGFARRSSSTSATSRIRSSRSSRPVCCFAETRATCVVPPHSSGCRPFGGEVGEHAVGVRVGQVDLVDRDDDRHVGRARVRDRLARLRHDAVVGGDDEHRDVGDLRAAGAHRRERLVARRVEERDLAAVDVDLVRADVLRDAAGLGRRRPCASADRVEQRRLAVVDVAHDRDDRRARLRASPRRPRRLSGSSSSSAACLIVTSRFELGGDQLDLLVGERLRRGLHLAEVHQDLDDVAASRRRAPARSRGRVTPDSTETGPGRRRGRRARAVAARRVVAAAPALARVARTRRLVVDHDAAPAVAGAAAAARAERTIRFASVSHSDSSV